MDNNIAMRQDAINRLKAAKAVKAKAVEEMKQILTDICLQQTGKAPTSFEVL